MFFQKLKNVGEEGYLKNVEENSIPYKILRAPIVYNPDFSKVAENISQAKMFYPNPDKNWGPKHRAVQKYNII